MKFIHSSIQIVAMSMLVVGFVSTNAIAAVVGLSAPAVTELTVSIEAGSGKNDVALATVIDEVDSSAVTADITNSISGVTFSTVWNNSGTLRVTAEAGNDILFAGGINLTIWSSDINDSTDVTIPFTVTQDTSGNPIITAAENLYLANVTGVRPVLRQVATVASPVNETIDEVDIFDLPDWLEAGKPQLIDGAILVPLQIINAGVDGNGAQDDYFDLEATDAAGASTIETIHFGVTVVTPPSLSGTDPDFHLNSGAYLFAVDESQLHYQLNVEALEGTDFLLVALVGGSAAGDGSDLTFAGSASGAGFELLNVEPVTSDNVAAGADGCQQYKDQNGLVLCVELSYDLNVSSESVGQFDGTIFQASIAVNLDVVNDYGVGITRTATIDVEHISCDSDYELESIRTNTCEEEDALSPFSVLLLSAAAGFGLRRRRISMTG